MPEQEWTPLDSREPARQPGEHIYLDPDAATQKYVRNWGGRIRTAAWFLTTLASGVAGAIVERIIWTNPNSSMREKIIPTLVIVGGELLLALGVVSSYERTRDKERGG